MSNMRSSDVVDSSVGPMVDCDVVAFGNTLTLAQEQIAQWRYI